MSKLYRNPSSGISLKVWQLFNKPTTHNSRTLAINFELSIYHQYFSNLSQCAHEISRTKSLHLSYSLDAFVYGAMQDDCVICLDELGKERSLLRMSCSHVFHGDCIANWFENSGNCPICRYQL
ncbi:hypothetical protein BC332_16434 [Capsicum chinense]|nr:hypothetical protein BC332_16434 [Capsicum chinense]